MLQLARNKTHPPHRYRRLIFSLSLPPLPPRQLREQGDVRWKKASPHSLCAFGLFSTTKPHAYKRKLWICASRPSIFSKRIGHSLPRSSVKNFALSHASESPPTYKCHSTRVEPRIFDSKRGEKPRTDTWCKKKSSLQTLFYPFKNLSSVILVEFIFL